MGTRATPPRCYGSRRNTSTPQTGILVEPWRLPMRTLPPDLDRSAPPEDEGREPLKRVRGRPATVRPIVSRPPESERLRRALVSVQHLEATDTNATAYDAALAVGPRHLIVAVNHKVAVLAKPGGTPLHEAALRAWFDRVLPAEVDFVFDPRVLYDQHDGRWVLTASAMRRASTDHAHLVVSVSKTDDPLGDWWIWGLPEKPNGPWIDQPCLGVDPHALYVSETVIGVGTRLRVIPKRVAYAGDPLTPTEFSRLMEPTDTRHPQRLPAKSVFPCHTWGAPGSQFLVSTRSDHTVERSLVVWTVSYPGAKPELTCRPLDVGAYDVKTPEATQQGGPPLDTGSTGGSRVRNAVYSGGAVWLAFASAYPNGGTLVAARWYQIDPVTPKLLQQGVFTASGVHYCYPAFVPDAHGNAVLVVGRSARTEYVSVHVTARRSSDPPNSLPASYLLHAGTTGHDNPDTWAHRNRWGDYHSAAVDPVDGVTVWVAGGYPVDTTTWRICVGSLRV